MLFFIMQGGSTKSPPYWYVDLKWVFGLLFSFTLLLNISLFLFSKLTSPEIAIPLASTIAAKQFSKNGLDDASDVDKVKSQFLATGRDKFYPFGEKQNVFLTREEVQTLSPRQIRLRVFEQIVEPIYYAKSGVDLQQYGVLAVININLHKNITNIFRFTFIPLVLFLSGFVYFSFGLWKLINPAMSLLMFSTLPALLLFLIEHLTPPAGDTGPLSILPREEMIKIVKPISFIFNLYFAIGTLLILIAIALKIFQKKKGQ